MIGHFDASFENLSLQIRIIREFREKVKEGGNIKKIVHFFCGYMVYNRGNKRRKLGEDSKKWVISGFLYCNQPFILL